MDKQEKKGIAIGAIFGAVIGVIAGILFAPKSGKETREDIKKTATKTADAVVEEAKHLQEETSKLLASAEAKISTLKGAASEQTKEKVDHVKHTASQVKSALSAFKSGESDDKDLRVAVAKAKEAHESLRTFLKK